MVGAGPGGSDMRSGKLAVFLVAALIVVLRGASAVADPRLDVLNTAARCNALPDYRQWLDCYYGAAQPMRELLGLAPAPAAQTKLVPPAGPATFRAASAAMPGGDTAPLQHMANYSFDNSGRFLVTLENGTVWRQTLDDIVSAHWRAAPQTYTASVERTDLGGHMMRVSDGHSYRVKKAP